MKIRLYDKYWLGIMAFVIVAASIYFTNFVIEQLSEQEQRKMAIWAEATRRLLNDEYNDFMFKIIEDNDQIPVIIADERDRYISSRNIKVPKHNAEEYYQRKIARFKELNTPIVIQIDDSSCQYIYYGNSITLTRLAYFPYVQMAVIAIFLISLLWALSSDKRNEQNRVWIGLTKETAHQLGTPISSLMAWNEILKAKYSPDAVFDEVDKDIDRLRMITERFSKIGSVPDLSVNNIVDVTYQAMLYMQRRTSKKIEYSFEDKTTEHDVMLSVPLYSWVVENLCRNAIDAMEGAGNIDFEMTSDSHRVRLEVTDSGKGIERSKYKTIFRPGYTTKQRGWGLGLSFAKRIVCDYHHGKIYVKSSDLGLGTTFVVEIPLSKGEV